MKQINFTCTIQMDTHDLSTDALSIVREAVEIINLELQRTGLNTCPQILPESVAIEKVVDNVQDDVDDNFEQYHTFDMLIGKYVCRDFTDVDPDISGVEVYTETGNRIGSMLGVSLPDPEDKQAVREFKNLLSDWIVDNEN